MRVPVPALVAGLLVAALGVAGLVRGSVPQSSASGSSAAAPIVVTNAYVRPPPVPADGTATAYFTIYNTTGTPDTLQSVVTGAGASAVLQVISGGQLRLVTGLEVPAHGSVSLAAGTGRAVISGLFGTLEPGQSVNLELTFARAGPIDVTATVIGVTAPAPGSSSTGAAK
jgi:copper(I)-binding protein